MNIHWKFIEAYAFGTYIYRGMFRSRNQDTLHYLIYLYKRFTILRDSFILFFLYVIGQKIV